MCRQPTQKHNICFRFVECAVTLASKIFKTFNCLSFVENVFCVYKILLFLVSTLKYALSKDP